MSDRSEQIDRLQRELVTAKRVADRALAQGELLASMSRAMLAAETDLGELLRTIVTRVADMVGDACIIRLVSEDGHALVPVAVDHADPEATPELAEVVAGLRPGASTRSRGAALLSAGTEELDLDSEGQTHAADPGWAPYLERFGPGGLLIAPLRARGETLGELVVTRADPERPYDDDDRNLLEDVASRAALAIANARLFVRAQDAEADLREANEELEHRVEARTADLARSNAELERFAAVASHDLRAPLRTIRSFVRLLEDEVDESLNDDARQYMRFIVDSAGNLDDLVGGLLSWASIGRKGEEEAEYLELDRLVEGVMRDLDAGIRQAEATIEVGALGRIWGRPVRLRQLVQNLVQNALRYRSQQRAPVIRIEAHEAKGRLLVSVIDNGIGIDAKHHARIFRMFKRLQGHGADGGLGLGLSLCEKIAAMHGSQLSVHSALDEGATFGFSLPLNAD